MGTNFYWKKPIQDKEYDWDLYGDIQVHIGKRSAAGAYCNDCGTTLCEDGTRDVHSSKKQTSAFDTRGWFNECPGCGIPRSELKGCTSFTWTLMKHKWNLVELLDSDEKVVVNEYDEEFTAKEFLDELSSVRIEFQAPYQFS